MTKKRKGITAAELMAKLEADPQFVANRARRREELEKRAAESRKAQAPLLEELRAVGCTVNTVWDLVNTAAPYPEALPILLDHLTRPYPPGIREGIGRALAVPEAIFAWDVLKRLYREEQEKRAKDGMAVALAAMADDDVLGDVIGILKDTAQGPSRGFLLSALDRSADPRARAALMELGTDPQLEKEIQFLLRRKLKRKQAKKAARKS